jgi:hypothetical protein
MGGGLAAGLAIGTGTLDVSTTPLRIKCDNHTCQWDAPMMFTLRDKYSFRSIDNNGKELPWYTPDNNLPFRLIDITVPMPIFTLIGRDYDIADRHFVTKYGSFPCRSK